MVQKRPTQSCEENVQLKTNTKLSLSLSLSLSLLKTMMTIVIFCDTAQLAVFLLSHFFFVLLCASVLSRLSLNLSLSLWKERKTFSLLSIIIAASPCNTPQSRTITPKLVTPSLKLRSLRLKRRLSLLSSSSLKALRRRILPRIRQL